MDNYRSVKFNNLNKHKVVAEEIIEEIQDEGEPATKSIKMEIPQTKQNDAKKNESWNRSIGVIARKPLVNLVKKKSSEPIIKNIDKNKDISDTDKKPETKSSDMSSVASGSGGLSLLAGYSGSDSDSCE